MELLGDVTMTLDDGLRSWTQWAHLPLSDDAAIGRRQDSLLRVLEPWMPQTLIEITNAHSLGWVVTAGTGVTVDVSGTRIEASVMPGGAQLLGRGAWRLVFPTLDHRCRLDVRVFHPSSRAPLDPRSLTRPRELTMDELLAARKSKVTAAAKVGMTPLTKYRLAVLYRHLLEDGPPPDNLCAAAGAALDMDEDAVRRLAYRIRDRLNEYRSNKLVSLDDLGDFLVYTGQVLNPDHLEAPAQPDE